MDAREDYEMKLEAIKAIADGRIKIPHHIPVAVYIQEAVDLHHWCQPDKESLTAAGLSWDLVEDLPLRVDALSEAESLWYVRHNTGEECAGKWAKLSPLAYDLKDRLLEDFRFAFRKRRDILAAVRAIAKEKGHAGMIQGLNDLAVLGRINPGLLADIHFDMSLLEQAAQTADEMAKLLAAVNTNRTEYSEAKENRDRAYTHLKEAVDEIREYGRFAMRKDKERLMGYRSNYIRTQNKKRREKKTDNR